MANYLELFLDKDSEKSQHNACTSLICFVLVVAALVYAHVCICKLKVSKMRFSGSLKTICCTDPTEQIWSASLLSTEWVSSHSYSARFMHMYYTELTPHTHTPIVDCNIFIYSLICDIDFIMVISDHYLDTEVCLYFDVMDSIWWTS